MKAIKWLPALFLVVLVIACTTPLQREVKLTINSEPPNAKIYEDGNFVGNTPLNLTYHYTVDQTPGSSVYTIPGEREEILALLRPRSFLATKDGFEFQTKSFYFPSTIKFQKAQQWYAFESTQEFFTQSEYSLLFLLTPQEAKSQQQQQQQQQTVVVMPSAAAAKTYGTLTIISTPPQAEVLLDGTSIAMTPVANLKVETGPHKIEIQKSGFKTWVRIWQVLADSPVKIEVELEKI
jgi:hypothetical protein